MGKPLEVRLLSQSAHELGIFKTEVKLFSKKFTRMYLPLMVCEKKNNKQPNPDCFTLASPNSLSF